jgi:hypothetical protein
MSERYKGFIVGSDSTAEGRIIWKLRVKDPNSPYDEQKLIVASIRGGLELARGLNVHFAIGTIDDLSGLKVLRAVDVCLEVPGKDQKTM